jgi:hypothetical protein
MARGFRYGPHGPRLRLVDDAARTAGGVVAGPPHQPRDVPVLAFSDGGLPGQRADLSVQRRQPRRHWRAPPESAGAAGSRDAARVVARARAAAARSARARGSQLGSGREARLQFPRAARGGLLHILLQPHPRGRRPRQRRTARRAGHNRTRRRRTPDRAAARARCSSPGRSRSSFCSASACVPSGGRE